MKSPRPSNPFPLNPKPPQPPTNKDPPYTYIYICIYIYIHIKKEDLYLGAVFSLGGKGTKLQRLPRRILGPRALGSLCRLRLRRLFLFRLRLLESTWEFPKIQGPQLRTTNSRARIIRTPTKHPKLWKQLSKIMSQSSV